MMPSRDFWRQIRPPRSVAILNLHLSAAIDLHAQIKQAHWNARGPGETCVYGLFDLVSAEVGNYADYLAERIGRLGAPACGAIQTAVERSYLKPYTLGLAKVRDHVFAVSGALATFGETVRGDVAPVALSGDDASAALLERISDGVDRQLYFIQDQVSVRETVALTTPCDRSSSRDGHANHDRGRRPDDRDSSRGTPWGDGS